MHLLFVCTGNTCRSPMAAYLAKEKILKARLEWEVRSAGLYALPGCPMSLGAQKVLQNRKINTSQHESSPLSRSFVLQADYIFTMTSNQKEDLLTKFPGAADRVFTMSEFATSDEFRQAHAVDASDIIDPFGGTDAAYATCALAIEFYLDMVIAKIKQAQSTDTGNC